MNKKEFDVLFESLGDMISQDKPEFWQVFDKLQKQPIRRILEVGVAAGGTFRFWQELVHEDDYIVGVDEGGNIAVPMKEKPEYFMVVGDSQDPATVERVKSYAPFDFCFIDADHSYEGCKKDWENYSPMVSPGGIVAFHDTGHPPVKKVFDEITLPKENIHTKLGIGIVYIE